jgi:hypothetical protein
MVDIGTIVVALHCKAHSLVVGSYPWALILFHIYNLYSLSFYFDWMIIVFLTLKVKARTQFNILEINHKEKKKEIVNKNF